ncbi:MAG: hypothetical protein IPP11_01750 [Chitinophagaceae bacterium]|nr:hypothetical protein [Chitinophagaceae bacterium]
MVCYRFILITICLIFYSNNFAQTDSSITKKARYAFALSPKNSDSALLLAKEALAEAAKIKDKSAMAEAYNSIGWAWQFKGNFDTAIYFLKNSHSLFKSLKDNYNLISVDINLSEVYIKQSRFAETLEKLMESDSATYIIRNESEALVQKTLKSKILLSACMV